MHNLCNNILIIWAVVTVSTGIDEEYYVEEEDDTFSNVTNESAARRRLDNKPLLKSNISDDSRDTRYSDTDKSGDIILFYNKHSTTEKRTNLEKKDSSKTEQKVLQSGNSNFSTNKITKDVIQTTLPMHIDSFEEYDYKNVIDSEDSQILREQSADPVLLGSNNTKSDTPYAKFYNLEPALNEHISLNRSIHIIDKPWYVPQDFPCWKLPVLYGELGTKHKKRNIFRIFKGNLENVIESSTETPTSYRAVEPQVSHVTNKWCEVEPCYGDHILCLFPNKGISNICDKEYKVYVPNIEDQFAVVNTINTMRNHIASGASKQYSHLPTAANMKQITYDYDLEDMAEAWLRQCLPGSAPCSTLNGNSVSHLECTKYAQYCCSRTSKKYSDCIPQPECYVYPIIGCIHIWYSSAGKDLTKRDILCGRSSKSTFNTVQLLWAETSQVGCAYGERPNGDIRVVCNFSPGAPFYLDTQLYCGIIAHNDIKNFRDNENITDLVYLTSLGVKWHTISKLPTKNVTSNPSTIYGRNILVTEPDVKHTSETVSHWGVDSLLKFYKEGWARKQKADRSNGSRSMTARLVAKHTFIDESEARCDSDESIYIPGIPASLCVEKGRTYHGLCYDFGDPAPGYRLIAIAAPIALFSLILYDLFSGVVRQTNN